MNRLAIFFLGFCQGAILLEAKGISYQSSFQLLKFHGDGYLDQGFGYGGMVDTLSSGEDSRVLSHLVDDEQNRSYLSMLKYDRSLEKYVRTIIRLTERGQLDRSFHGGEGLIWEENDYPSTAYFSGGTIDEEERIVVSYLFNVASEDGRRIGFICRRISKTGEWDTSFGESGKVTYLVPVGSGVTSIHSPGLAAGHDKKVLIWFETWSDTESRGQTIFRYTENGQLDLSFGAGGRVDSSCPGDCLYPKGILPVDDNKFIAWGAFYDRSRNIQHAKLYQFHLDGRLDKSFGNEGVLSLESDPTNYSLAETLIVDKNGNFFVGVQTHSQTGSESKVVHVLRGGNVDAAFGDEGSVSWMGYGAAQPLVFFEDKIVAVGRSSFRDGLLGKDVHPICARRYTLMGKADETFGYEGRSCVFEKGPT